MANRQRTKKINLALKNRREASKAMEIARKLEDVETRILAGKTYMMVNRKRINITVLRDDLAAKLEKLNQKIERRLQMKTAA